MPAILIITTARMKNKWQVLLYYSYAIGLLLLVKVNFCQNTGVQYHACIAIVLEYELHKTQETIKSLRGSLTKATAHR